MNAGADWVVATRGVTYEMLGIRRDLLLYLPLGGKLSDPMVVCPSCLSLLLFLSREDNGN